MKIPEYAKKLVRGLSTSKLRKGLLIGKNGKRISHNSSILGGPERAAGMSELKRRMKAKKKGGRGRGGGRGGDSK